MFEWRGSRGSGNHRWETIWWGGSPLDNLRRCKSCGLKREGKPGKPRRLELPDGLRLAPQRGRKWVLEIPRPVAWSARTTVAELYPGTDPPSRYGMPSCDWVQRMPSHAVQRQAKAIGLKWAVRRLHDWDAIAVALDAYAEGGEPVWPEGFGVVAGRLHDNLEAGWIKPSATVKVTP